MLELIWFIREWMIKTIKSVVEYYIVISFALFFGIFNFEKDLSEVMGEYLVRS